LNFKTVSKGRRQTIDSYKNYPRTYLKVYGDSLSFAELTLSCQMTLSGSSPLNKQKKHHEKITPRYRHYFSSNWILCQR